MLIREQMTNDPVTVPPETSVLDALHLMREKQIRCLPVIDKHGRLAGIVSEKDLLNASPSPIPSLSVWEIHYLLAKVTVDRVMTREVITVSEDTPIEEAARLMADHRIEGLPVMRDKALVGLITEADLFRVLLDLFGGRRPGVRLAVSISRVPGTVARVASAIINAGGEIVGLGLNEEPDATGVRRELTAKVQDAPRDKLVEAVRPVVLKILDVREV